MGTAEIRSAGRAREPLGSTLVNIDKTTRSVQAKGRIAVLTSGGDAQGMNAAVRAIVRGGLSQGVDVFIVHDGYHGLVKGGDQIRPATWNSVGGILHRGGTSIGTARSKSFTTRDGRRKAAFNLVSRGIDRLAVIGGDGSLTGIAIFGSEWPELLAELVDRGEITAEVAEAHPILHTIGLVGSIDNDLVGTDSTIGADSALHRITEAIDAITSTAASHQRTFVIEVMGRRCGYLAVRGGLAGAADWLLIPEDPPRDGWEERMIESLAAGRQAGRRDSIVVLAEGAIDRHGKPITAEHVRSVLEEDLGEDTRITVLGHVQRGGAPSAFDRYMSTILGFAAVDDLLSADSHDEPQIMGLRNNRITHLPLMNAINATRAANRALDEGDYAAALAARGGSFREALARHKILNGVEPDLSAGTRTSRPRRIAVLHAGGPAPGMNTAARAVTRFALDRGHHVIGVEDGFTGLIEGRMRDLGWMDVSGWGPSGGAKLGVTRRRLDGKDLYAIARSIEAHRIDALVVIGGWSAYEACARMWRERSSYPTFDIPIFAIPTTINNNLPGTDLSVGSDTALNSIVESIDRIKQSAVAAGRCFVVEVMGRHCGYLALMAALATGAERVFLPEEGITLAALEEELTKMKRSFKQGKRLELVIRSEGSSKVYTTDFMARLFEEEGGSLFSVRTAILGHLQQGGDPSPFDRMLATRFAWRVINELDQIADDDHQPACFVGVAAGQMGFTDFADFNRLVDIENQRPKTQWWLELRGINTALAHPPSIANPVSGKKVLVDHAVYHPNDQYHTQEET